MPFSPPDEQIELELNRIIGSPTFARAARQRALLQYLIAARRTPGLTRVKESAIALDVFERDAAKYDSATDGIVRVSINRLREMLDRYYESDGAECTLRFEIALGSYLPVLRRATPRTLPPMPRIAVLPLANFTGEPNNDALCDGLTEDIIDALTRVPDIRVIARTSSFRFKGQSRDIREIAKALQVDALLEGSVQQVGDRLRVTAQLILGSDGTHLWSHAFHFAPHEREGMQRAVVDIMLRALGKRAAEQTASADPAPAPGISIEAQRLVDQARGLNVTQVPDNLAYAETLAQRATVLAPEHADAWFVLAMVRYSRRSLFVSSPSGHTAASVREPLDRALALDAKNAQAISLSAYLLITDEMRWNDALARVQEAVALAPNHSGVNARHAFIQLSFGDFDAAVRSYAHVFSIDPLAPPARYHYALSLAYAGRFDDAIECIEAGTLALGESIMQRDTMCAVLDIRGDMASAREYAEAALARYPTSTSIAMHAAHCRAATGDSAGARALAERITDAHSAPQHCVHMYIESGFPDTNGDAFFSHALAISDAHEPQVLIVPAHPLFKRFHKDPRWAAVLKKIGFPTQPRA